MALKMMLWLFALMFIAMVYNVTTAYTAMGDLNVQGKFQEIGLIEDGKTDGIPVPPRKPVPPQEMLAGL